MTLPDEHVEKVTLGLLMAMHNSPSRVIFDSFKAIVEDHLLPILRTQGTSIPARGVRFLGLRL